MARAIGRALVGCLSYWLNVHFLYCAYESHNPQARPYFEAGALLLVTSTAVSLAVATAVTEALEESP